MEQLRHKGKDFVQNAWKWALEHPALAKYIIISGGFSTSSVLTVSVPPPLLTLIFTLAFSTLAGVLMWFHSMRLRYVRNNTILELDLDGKEIVEGASGNIFNLADFPSNFPGRN